MIWIYGFMAWCVLSVRLGLIVARAIPKEYGDDTD